MAEKDIVEMLDAPLPWEEITFRKSKNTWLAYVSGEYVKRRLSEIFGPLGWSWHAHERFNHEENGVEIGGSLQVHLADDDVRSRSGFAFGTNYNGLDFAAASGNTDALKRAAATLGNSLGLQLYKQLSPGFSDAYKGIAGRADIMPAIQKSEVLTDYEKAFLTHFDNYLVKVEGK